MAIGHDSYFPAIGDYGIEFSSYLLPVKALLFLILQIIFAYSFSFMAMALFLRLDIFMQSLSIVVLFASAIQTVLFINIFLFPFNVDFGGFFNIFNSKASIQYFCVFIPCVVLEMVYCGHRMQSYNPKVSVDFMSKLLTAIVGGPFLVAHYLINVVGM